LPSAGAAIAVPTSPIPPTSAELFMMCTSIGGVSLIRIMR